MIKNGSAQGKLMILGEHAVVYGYPCIVQAIDKKITARVEKSEHDSFIMAGADNRFAESALIIFRKTYGIAEPVAITTEAEFTDRMGFGSSAAATVATLKALALFFQIPMSEREFFDIGYKAVLAVQGTGSGFDVAAAVYGGVLYYAKKGEIIDRIAVEPLPLIIGYTGQKASTTNLVEKVYRAYNQHKKEVTGIFSLIGKLVEEGKMTLEKADWVRLGQIMTKNHELLTRLAVSTPQLDAMVRAAIANGAYGAKLSGAGGGDCMIALSSEKNRADVIHAIQQAGGAVV